MKKVTIYGERCSGTNYLEELLLLNFEVEITWNYGWKHFFGFSDLSESDDVLFVGIVRNLYDWINSMYREKYHIPHNLTKNIDTFLTYPFYSVLLSHDEHTFEVTEIDLLEDVHIETHEKYKNIFELRCVKNKFLIEKMPTLVKSYCLITHDDLCANFINTMNKLKDCGLAIKPDIKFPVNVSYDIKNKQEPFIKKVNEISKQTIDEIIMDDNELLFYENMLFSKINVCDTETEH